MARFFDRRILMRPSWQYATLACDVEPRHDFEARNDLYSELHRR